MSQKTRTPPATCAAIAALLPLAGHDLLSEEETARLHAHLETCAACRRELAIYEQVEAAWHRAIELPQPAAPMLPSAALIDEPVHPTERTNASTLTEIAPRQPIPARRSRARRVLGGVAALAAVFLIGVLVGAALLARGQLTGVIKGQPTSTIPPYQNIFSSGFKDISMVSATEGWAVGSTYTALYNHTSDPTTSSNDVLLWHYQNGTWSPVPLPLHGELESISMDSPTDGWAVGTQYTDQQQFLGALLLHYDGHTWQSVPAQGFEPALRLAQVQMLSASDGWIVGDVTSGTYGNRPVPGGIWHYDGQTWKALPAPAPLGTRIQNGEIQVAIASISMLSPTEGWAVGALYPITSIQLFPTPTPVLTSENLSPEGIILHYTGGQWEVQQTISHASFGSLSMLSANDGWIGGGSITETPVSDPHLPGQTAVQIENTPLLLHYTHGQWVNATSSIKVDLSTIFAVQSLVLGAPNDGWMVCLPGGAHPESASSVLLHYDGTSWSEVSLPAIKNTQYYTITRLVMVSPAEGWAVGYRALHDAPGSTLKTVPIIFHYLNGHWSVVLS